MTTKIFFTSVRVGHAIYSLLHHPLPATHHPFNAATDYPSTTPSVSCAIHTHAHAQASL